ncbi:MAG: putative CAMK family protein kinase, partial [Streblomastix strix]
IWTLTRDADLCLIQEFCSGGDSRKLIIELQKIPEAKRINHVWELFAQIVLALNHLHTHNVIHRDIKPENIFIMEDGTARLGDFGLAKDLIGTYNATMAGTKMGFKADVYAVGVVICELLTGKHPFIAENEQTTISNIIEGKPVELPDFVPIEMKKIVLQMTNSV